MNTVYAYEAVKSDALSIFLAGPTPRQPDVESWRDEALHHLSSFAGNVYIPEPRDGNWSDDYMEQVEWEELALDASTVILFWIPRNDTDMLALTTNDEWGTWKNSGKCVLGAPDDAFRVRYQIYYANKIGVPYSNTLSQTCINAIGRINNGTI